MAGFFLLLMALGAAIALVAILVGAYHLILRPLFRVARFLVACALYIPAAIAAAVLAPIPPASRAVARAYRAVAGF